MWEFRRVSPPSMKFALFIISSFLVIACGSAKQTLETEQKQPKYSTYYYKNKIVKMPRVPATEPLEMPADVVGLETDASAHYEPKPLSQQDKEVAKPIATNTPKAKFLRTNNRAENQAARDETDEWVRATKDGSTGLFLSVLGFILAVVALYANLSVVFALAIIAILAGFVFSLNGLKGGNRKDAILGLIFSGIPIAIGIVALILYLIRR